MSLFERFAYRKKASMTVNGISEKENELKSFVSPNKAHQSAVTRVSETPDSLLSLSAGKEQRIPQQQQRRRRARILSSSEDETDTVPCPQGDLPAATPKKASTLFSEFPQSKRRKKPVANSLEELEAVKLDMHLSARTLTLDPPSSGNPRRLFKEDRGDFMMGQGQRAASSCLHKDTDSMATDSMATDSATAKSLLSKRSKL